MFYQLFYRLFYIFHSVGELEDHGTNDESDTDESRSDMSLSDMSISDAEEGGDGTQSYGTYSNEYDTPRRYF